LALETGFLQRFAEILAQKLLGGLHEVGDHVFFRDHKRVGPLQKSYALVRRAVLESDGEFLCELHAKGYVKSTTIGKLVRPRLAKGAIPRPQAESLACDEEELLANEFTEQRTIAESLGEIGRAFGALEENHVG
jgi:hypothetical protein